MAKKSKPSSMVKFGCLILKLVRPNKPSFVGVAEPCHKIEMYTKISGILMYRDEHSMACKKDLRQLKRLINWLTKVHDYLEGKINE